MWLYQNEKLTKDGQSLCVSPELKLVEGESYEENVHFGIGKTENYCQSEIETGRVCGVGQCDHCKTYYAPLESPLAIPIEPQGEPTEGLFDYETGEPAFIELTKEQFINNVKALMKEIESAYADAWSDPTEEDDPAEGRKFDAEKFSEGFHQEALPTLCELLYSKIIEPHGIAMTGDFKKEVLIKALSEMVRTSPVFKQGNLLSSPVTLDEYLNALENAKKVLAAPDPTDKTEGEYQSEDELWREVYNELKSEVNILKTQKHETLRIIGYEDCLHDLYIIIKEKTGVDVKNINHNSQ